MTGGSEIHGRDGAQTFTDVLSSRARLRPCKNHFTVCVCVCVCMSPAHNLLFLPAATVVPLSYCFCFEKHSHMCLSPDNKFIADFQSIICTERTISADKTPQLITAAAIKMYENKTVLSLSSALNCQECCFGQTGWLCGYLVCCLIGVLCLCLFDCSIKDRLTHWLVG